MDIDSKHQKIADLLSKFSQNHLLAFYHKLDNTRKCSLINQIQNLDFTQIPGWIENYIKNLSPAPIPADFEPAPSYPPAPRSPQQQQKYDQAEKLGSKLIQDGKIAAFVVAGGQGTRLGFDGPKGNFPISPIKNKTLFRIFAEYIIAAAQKYNFNPAWYIMTSPPLNSLWTH